MLFCGGYRGTIPLAGVRGSLPAFPATFYDFAQVLNFSIASWMDGGGKRRAMRA